MGIPTDQLQKITSVVGTDSIMVDTDSEGTGRLSFDAAAEFFRGGLLPMGPGGVPYGKELTESWASLQARIKQGDFSGIHIGDFKTITLSTGETVIMEVAGIDQYYRCGDQEIGHHVDFISRDCLKGARQFNTTATNNGNATEKNPWRASDLFKALNNEVFATLPSDLQSCIIEKRALLEERYSASSSALTSDTGYQWNFMGKLWLPNEIEVFSTAHWSEIGYGTWGGGCNIQYPIFMGGAKHIIKGDGNGGSRVAWWEAVAPRDSASYVCAVAHHGYASHTSAANTGIRAPLCFRIG